MKPEPLAFPGHSQWTVARIEVENQRAAEIDLRTLAFSVDGVAGSFQGGVRAAVRLDDIDGDTNVDLEVRFQSALLMRLLRQATGDTALVRASWRYNDGTEGTASAQITLGG